MKVTPGFSFDWSGMHLGVLSVSITLSITMKKITFFVGILAISIMFSSVAFSQCVGQKKDQELLGQIVESLKSSVPEIAEYSALVDRYFVYDLSDLSKKGIFNIGMGDLEPCINFLDGHVYHFSVVYTSFSRSNIGVLEKGNLRVFPSINCPKGNKELLDRVTVYVKKADGIVNRGDTLDRLRDYRRYGYFRATDETIVVCRN